MITKQSLFDAAFNNLACVQRGCGLSQHNLGHSQIGLMIAVDTTVAVILHGNRLLFVTMHPRVLGARSDQAVG
ncbi:hypothetical protein QU42_02420 [Bradyrhizobium sp. UASWS1016]|nr:hypothetical protein QU42_02420 [Bradyrhizobium sp. UASWS1016]